VDQQGAITSALEEYLVLLAPYLHSAVLSTRASAYLRRLAHVLPATDLAGFECGLGTGIAPVDLIIRLPHGGLRLGKALRQNPCWQLVANIYRQLEDDSSVAGDVNVIDLEFDLLTAPPAVPVPGVFFELSREPAQPKALIEQIAERLCGAPLPSRLRRSLAQVVEALPPRGRIIHLGAMLSRPGGGLRVVVGRIPDSGLFEYLRQAGWAGDRQQIEDGIACFGSHFDTMLLSMDLSDTVSPRLGFECHIDPKPGRSEAWRVLLHRMVQLKLCTPAKAAGLLAWPGVSLRHEHPTNWPRHLRWGDRLLGDRAASVVVRFLSHLKLVSRPTQPQELKGYLGFAHYWLDQNGRQSETITTSRAIR
jgi:hypothetical protein